MPAELNQAVLKHISTCAYCGFDVAKSVRCKKLLRKLQLRKPRKMHQISNIPENAASYALYSILCLVLNRETAQNIGRPDKAVSPTYFNT